MPSLHEIEMKELEIKDAVQYQYKDEDIDHIVKEKKKFSKTNTDKIAQLKIDLLKEQVRRHLFICLLYLISFLNF